MKAAVAFAFALAASVPASAAEPAPFVDGSWRELTAQHRGRPAIVHFWGLTCAPCLAEMPQWARLAHDAAPGAVVMVAADPVTVKPSDLERVLVKAGFGGVESWRFADDFAEKLQSQIDPAWRGELPFTVLLSADGSTDTFTGPADFAAMSAWLAAKPAEPGG